MTKRLTRAEEQIMLILWKLREATIREVMNELNEPETPYTTVSTVVRVLEKKDIVGHRAVGTTYLYHPLLARKEYLKGLLALHFCKIYSILIHIPEKNSMHIQLYGCYFKSPV